MVSYLGSDQHEKSAWPLRTYNARQSWTNGQFIKHLSLAF